jgi:dihydrofolate reductase
LSFRHCSRRCSALGFLSSPSPAVASSSLSSSSSSSSPSRFRCLGLSGAAALGPSQLFVAPNSCSARRLLRLSSSVSFYSAIGCDPPARPEEDLPPPAMAPPTDAAFTVAAEHDGSVSEEHVPAAAAAAVEETWRRSFQIVVAATRERGIGKDGQLPWKLPTDMNFFKTVTSLTTSATKKNAVVMGRRTWESIPDKFRPLRGRLNVVLTRSSRKSLVESQQHENVLVSDSFDSALALLAAPPLSSEVESVFVIGGGQVYRSVISLSLCPVFLPLAWLCIVVFFSPRIESSANNISASFLSLNPRCNKNP